MSISRNKFQFNIEALNETRKTGYQGLRLWEFIVQETSKSKIKSVYPVYLNTVETTTLFFAKVQLQKLFDKSNTKKHLSLYSLIRDCENNLELFLDSKKAEKELLILKDLLFQVESKTKALQSDRNNRDAHLKKYQTEVNLIEYYQDEITPVDMRTLYIVAEKIILKVIENFTGTLSLDLIDYGETEVASIFSILNSQTELKEISIFRTESSESEHVDLSKTKNIN